MKRLLGFLIVAGCATAPDSVEQGALHEPPESVAVAPLPVGPEVLDREARVEVSLEPGDSGVEVSRAEVQAFMRQGPAFALTQVVVEPVHGERGFVGFRLVSATREALRVLSPQIQPGDVIVRVNGVRVERPDDFLQGWNVLKDTEVIRLDALRDGVSVAGTWTVK